MSNSSCREDARDQRDQMNSSVLCVCVCGACNVVPQCVSQCDQLSSAIEQNIPNAQALDSALLIESCENSMFADATNSQRRRKPAVRRDDVATRQTLVPLAEP